MEPDESTEAGRLEILRRAQAGDEAMAPAVRRILRGAGQKATDIANMARHTRRSMAAKVAETDWVSRVGYELAMEHDAKELAGPDASPLEEMLAERVTMAAFRLHYFEALYVRNIGDYGTEWDEVAQKRLSAAHRDYLAACLTLAKVRKLQVAVVQVNVAGRQVVQNLLMPGGEPSGD